MNKVLDFNVCELCDSFNYTKNNIEVNYENRKNICQADSHKQSRLY